MMTRSWPSVLMAALTLILCARTVEAQTVFVMKAPAGSTIEVVLNTKPVGTATVSPTGEASIPMNLQGTTGKAEIDAYLFVDVCESLRRVVVVERGVAPPPEDGCNRQQIEGLFLVRRPTTIVFNFGGIQPTVLLRQGSYNPRAPVAFGGIPNGWMLSAAAGYGGIGNIVGLQCGNVVQCGGDDSGLIYGGAAGFWITPNIGAEVTYLRPPEVTIRGSETNSFSFNTSFDVHVLTIAGMGGVPIRRLRPYGKFGLTYHHSSMLTNQTIGTATQAIELKTEGWSWMFSGGLEAWLSQRVALYGEIGRGWLKGDSIFEGEGRLDDRVTYMIGGVRVHILP